MVAGVAKDEQYRKRIGEYIIGDSIWIRRTGDLSGSGKATSVKTEVGTRNADNPPSAVWKPNSTGYQETISALFPEPIFVRAMHDAAGEVTSLSANTTIGLLVVARAIPASPAS